jgi:uncharacterized protein (TIGR02453 family)
MGKRYFGPDLFAFLRDLAENNDRAWFKANQARFESAVRQPALDFITDFGENLASISPHFVADARTVGGSLFRIQRDTRFSKDKTPYKLNTGMHFRHAAAENAYAPGYYLHLEPRNCFMGVGIWHPDTAAANLVRARIASEPQEWTDAVGDPRFAELFALTGDSLKRPPRGFQADHPLVEDLKRKDFIATAKLRQSEVTSGSLIDDFEGRCRLATPFMRFICRGLGVEF